MAVDELPIVLDREAEAPLAVQVADALRAAAAGGVLRVGERLSSTRALAARLRVSRSVVAAAYDQLLAEGWLVGRRGSGTYLAAAPNTSAGQPAPAPRPAAPPAARVDLNSGRPCLEVLDRAAWRRAWRAAADRRPDTLPDYPGRPEFRRAVVEHLLRHRGLNAHPDQVLATAGVTAGLHEVAARLPPGAVVAMEEPGYQRAANALLDRGLRVVPAEMDDDGLRVDRLPAGLAAVYCTPAHQFPLGSRLPADRRVALVERARAEGFLVIEDDYDGELRYDVAPLPLLVALGPDVVAHLGTASKLLTPTLGVGWLVAPPALHAGVLAARERSGSRPSPAGQLVFAGLAEYGDLARHLRRLRATLAVRREMVIEAMAGSGAPVLGDAAGAHLRVGLPSAAAERAVVAGADAAGVLVPPLGDYHVGAARVFGVSVGYAGPGTAELRRAVPVVADLVGEAWSGQGVPARATLGARSAERLRR
ncbi:PLP-dependent aminotransferase family protein [Pseudonocardia eucalypti]|uniref:PLP-dependent aminotransferase family protein n=1 Tax=Pseudonocardia eucalypti TaxID=648755 RepID=A0ABP9QA20_9PSEU|nr:GntR family transcriptional regulator/MocR family aminotransferase [Pseudonocardia eucalypti]